MKGVLAAVATTGLAGLGGAFAVYGSFDDSPGGTLIGLALVVVALAISARRAARSSDAT